MSTPKNNVPDDSPIPVPGTSLQIETEDDGGPSEKLNIGLSLSHCVIDMERRDFDVSAVKELRTPIVAPTLEKFQKICEQYQQTHWRNCREGTKIAMDLWDAGKVKMPVLKHHLFPIMLPGKHWVGSITDIRWHPVIVGSDGKMRKNANVIIRITNQRQQLALTAEEVVAFRKTFAHMLEEKD